MRRMTMEKLVIEIHENRMDMGAAAGAAGAKIINGLLSEKDELNVMFAAAPSQNEVLEYLVRESGVDFSRINAYHMDEYIGLPGNAPQLFGNYLKDHIFSRVPFKNVYYIGHSADEKTLCERYSKLLEDKHMDVCFMGIGENGHIAFNDPQVADFNDSKLIKIVALDEVCRQQQVNDKCFENISDVPKYAMTVTIPYMMKSEHIICTVPGVKKADAVYCTLTDGIRTECPASILRRHPNAVMYIDADAASRLPQ